MKRLLFRFLRSPLGLFAIALDAVFAVVLAVAGLLTVPFAIGAFLLVSCVTVLTLMQTRLGGEAVVHERQRERDERNARILGGVAAARKRLSLLRIDEPDISAALERLVYVAGKYLEAQVRGADRDPEAEDAVLGAIEAVDDYLRMEDAARSGRHFHGGVDRNEGERVETERSMVERTARVLNAASDEIERRLDLGAGGAKDGVAAADRAAARDEVE